MDHENFKCEIIDWRITSNCNCKCDYCYASNSVSEMSDDEIDIVLDCIISSGCKTVCISGGEPLLSKNALKIIKYLNTYGISIYLSTNGTKFMEYREELEKYISKLSLPLDGYDETTNSINGRIVNDSSINGFNSVIEILEYYKNHHHDFSIKIGTVLTKNNLNIEHFQKMFNLLKKYPIDFWKIYEFIPEARGNHNYEKLKISKTEINGFKYEFQKFYENYSNVSNFDFSLIEKDSRNSAYFIIQANGDVIIPIEKQENNVEEVKLGNLLLDPLDKLFDKWKDTINKDKYIKNSVSRKLQNHIINPYVDNIDKKILYELDKNPLTDISSISSILEIDEISVRKRIERLYSIRAIKHTMPIIDVSRFGLNVYLLNLFFKLDNTMNNVRIADILCHEKSIAWVAECVELNKSTDLAIFRVAIFAEDNYDLDERLQYLESIFSNSLDSYEIDLVPDKYVFKQRYLVENDNSNINSLDDTHIILNGPKTKLTKSELSILLAMKYLKKINYNDLSKITSYKNKKIEKTINGLISKTIINKFQIVFDTNVIGYKCYIIFFKFINFESKKQFEKFIKKIPNVSHINTLNTGKWDMDMEFQVESPSQFRDVYNEIFIFKNEIKESKIMLIKKEHKFRFLIDKTTQAFEKNCTKNKLGTKGYVIN